MNSDATAVIKRQFRGPNHSGNGGYSCGVLAKHLTGVISVRLHKPPPLERPLSIRLDRTNNTAQMLDGEVLIASAGAHTGGTISAPKAPTLTDLEHLTGHFPSAEEHILPECFVCGPKRTLDDALCLYPRPVPQGDVVAHAWTPAPQFADGDGLIRTEVIWAALDCPSYFGLQKTDMLAVLGTLGVDLKRRPQAEEPCIVSGWFIQSEGRKYEAGSALYSGSGELLAAAQATWIQINPDQLLSA